MQITCMLHFEGKIVYIDRLESHIPKLWKYTAENLTKLCFILI